MATGENAERILKMAQNFKTKEPLHEDIELADLSLKQPKAKTASKPSYSLEEVQRLLN